MEQVEINALITQAENHLSTVREYINTPRYQYKVISNLPTWNRICSELDTKNGFTMVESVDGTPRDRIKDVDIPHLITLQLSEGIKMLTAIGERLMERDRAHKAEFAGTRLSDLIPPTLSYFFEKVGEAISDPHGSTLDFGLQMLSGIIKSFRDFEAELQRRGELQGRDYLQYDLHTYNR